MAAISTSRRAAAGIAFIVAGALLLLAVLLGVAGVGTFGAWPTILGYLAIAVGFVILAVGSVANLVARIALIVGAVGWFLLALAPLVALPAGFGTFAALAAAAGGVVGAIVLYTGKEITDRSAIAFIVTTIVAAIILLAGVAGVGLGVFGQILALVFAAGLIVTGVLFYRVQRSRRR
jgi:hypothetical protein